MSIKFKESFESDYCEKRYEERLKKLKAAFKFENSNLIKSNME